MPMPVSETGGNISLADHQAKKTIQTSSFDLTKTLQIVKRDLISPAGSPDGSREGPDVRSVKGAREKNKGRQDLKQKKEQDCVNPSRYPSVLDAFDVQHVPCIQQNHFLHGIRCLSAPICAIHLFRKMPSSIRILLLPWLFFSASQFSCLDFVVFFFPETPF
ncbi:hypothetical protein VTK73DRAFT_2754 [Phialemonium thermophilum]|uniref:Uncharacterized protein n=1 Tax=Phialemonium thermophilum TaxID=223376 RepID=A0ABR3Y177_9PEZI